MLNEQAIIEAVLSQYKLPIDGYHGIAHWARVYQNGTILAEDVGLHGEQITIVKLFAMLHDACRLNEDHDPGHGPRAALLAVRMFREAIPGVMLGLSQDSFDQLYTAINEHTMGKAGGSDFATIEACWDADRLDLDRVGIVPDKKFLTTRNKSIVNTARVRGISNCIMPLTFKRWGFDPYHRRLS